MDTPYARIKAVDNGTERVDPDGRRHWEPLTKRGSAHLELYADRLVHTGRNARTIPLKDVRWVAVGGKHNGRAIWPKTFVLVGFRDTGAERIAGFKVLRSRHAVAWVDGIAKAARIAGAALVERPTG